MVGEDDGLQGLSVRMNTVGGRISALELMLGSLIQELKRLPLKIDD